MKIVYTLAASAIMATGLWSCSDKPESLTIERLDRFVSDYPQLAEDDRAVLTDSMMPGIDLYVRYNGEDAADMDASLRYLSHTPAVVVFGEDVAAGLPDLSGAEAQLGELRANLLRQLPDARLHRVFGVVTGDPYESVIVSDSLVLVALNHYLGADYAGYQGMPEYRRRTKTVEHIAPDVAQAVVSVAYPYEPRGGEQLVNRMLYDGAVLYAMHTLLPELSFGQLTGWTPEQVKWLEDNENDIYRAMIERDLLYSTSEDDMRRVLDPSPVTSIIHVEAPGQAGRYIGYKIAESYACRHGDAALSQMLSADWYNAQNTLAESGYTAAR